MKRLKSVGDEGAKLSQALFDFMFADMERNLREMGVGDLSVGKQVKKMAAAYYGRVKAYDEALNWPTTLPDSSDGGLSHMSTV